jgi:hypothetical protein
VQLDFHGGSLAGATNAAHTFEQLHINLNDVQIFNGDLENLTSINPVAHAQNHEQR